MNKKKAIGSLILNIFTFLSVLGCMIYIFINSKRPFKMFTTQSNFVAGIVAGIIIIFDILIILNKIKDLPKWLKIIKMIVTTGVTLTFLVVTLYLGFVAVAMGYSYFLVFENTNLFFHLFTPLSALFSFILFEGTTEIKKRYTLLNLLHMGCYSIFYSINVFTHLTPEGKVDRKYDWYYFIIGENWTFAIVITGMVLITFGIGFILWFMNKKIKEKQLFE